MIKAKATKKEKENQFRYCSLTNEKKSKTELIRFVIGPEKELVADIKANLPGRGLWITAEKQILKKAIEKHTFERGFKQKVKIESNIECKVEDLLAKAALGRLKIANKAGEAIYGSTKLMAALEKETIIALIHASEASGQSGEKLDKKLQSKLDHNSKMQQNGLKKPFTCFTGEQLSLAFGAANVIHAGLKHGGATKAAIAAMHKYVAYTGK